MDERRDLVDREELRRLLEREGDCCNPDGSHAFTLRWVIEILDAMPAVECPRGWTRDEVLAELDAAEQRGDKAVVKELSFVAGQWYEYDRQWINSWHPEVRRYDVRVEVVERAPEWVPWDQPSTLLGRTLEGRSKPITALEYGEGDSASWSEDPVKNADRRGAPISWHAPLPVNLETGQVAVRPKAAT